jgi:hypothetical protein
MPRCSARARILAAAALGLVLVPVASGCTEEPAAGEASVSKAVADCRDRWHEVAGTVAGLDQDTDPSALADRWTSVLATIDYYENTESADGCETTVAAQEKAIEDLRAFVERVRPFDMTYQLSRVSAAVDVYLHDPLPAPTKDARGRTVRPPSQDAVRAALQTLADDGATANQDLAPGWGQLESVELTDAAAVSSALSDLNFLAQDSAAWKRCEAALTVIDAALTAQAR